MKFFNKMLSAAMIALVIGLGSLANAAVTGKTEVAIEFPEIIYLHYVPYLELIFTGTDEAFAENKAIDKQPLAQSVIFDAKMEVSPKGVGGSSEYLEVTVKNVWAVRGITKTGEIRVDPEIVEKKAVDSSGNSATYMEKLQVSYGSTAGDPIDVPAPGLPYKNAVKGDIQFVLNIEKVTRAGLHKGIVYTITATATP